MAWSTPSRWLASRLETPETADASERARADDAALVRRARDGDRAAFSLLHARLAPRVHALLLAHAPPADADDLVQEVFLAAWRHLGDLREETQVSAWLFTIARHSARRAHRRAR